MSPVCNMSQELWCCIHIFTHTLEYEWSWNMKLLKRRRKVLYKKCKTLSERRREMPRSPFDALIKLILYLQVWFFMNNEILSKMNVKIVWFQKYLWELPWHNTISPINAIIAKQNCRFMRLVLCGNGYRFWFLWLKLASYYLAIVSLIILLWS